MSGAEFDFHMRVVDVDPTGYYYPRWDNATPLVVRAADRAAALRQVWDVMGQPPKHRKWSAQVDRVESAAYADAKAVTR